eukprot:1331408-Amphidinium_carterae.1
MSYARGDSESRGLLDPVPTRSGRRSGVAECVYHAGFSFVGELLKCICCLPSFILKTEPMLTIEQGSVGVLTHFGVFERVLEPG